MTHIARIFPPGLPLVHGPKLTDELAAWAARRIPHVGPSGFGPCWAAGVVRQRELAAVVVYHGFEPDIGLIHMSVAADTPQWASKRVIGALFGIAFQGRLGAKVRKVVAVTASNNARAVKFCAGIKMTREAVLAEHFSPKVHAVVFRMLERDWRKNYGGE